MAKAETTTARSPRGAKPVSQAFFTALETIPEATRAAVSKSALALIRDQMKTQREKAKVAAAKDKATAAKEKARNPVAEKSLAAKSTAKVKAASEAKPAPKATPAKRRPRKPAEVPAAA
jgi:hypothetical protein